jgi:2-dehydro-3-deoxyphosphogluconate aldolase/(4S)-4-hydroxy-2-oxoglutarate aldolase
MDISRLKAIPDIFQMPVVGIVRNMSMADFARVMPVFREAGLKLVEVTMNTPEATKMIRYAIKEFSADLIVGAGTVCTTDDLTAAISAGARFIVTPIVDEKVISRCTDRQIPVFAGAFSPTEVFHAWQLGAAVVKLFPAGAAGLQYLQEIRGPLGHIPMMPTGGIDQHNMTAYFKAGAVAVGVGGKLFNEAMVREQNWNGLIEHFATFVRAALPYATKIPLTLT